MTTSWQWNHFHITGPLWGESPVTGGFSSNGKWSRTLISPLLSDKLLNKQWNGWWFEKPWYLCGVTVMMLTLLSLAIVEVVIMTTYVAASDDKWTSWQLQLTHWGRVTHICVNKLTIIGSDNSLSPGRRQAIIWTNARILLIGPLGTNISEILIKI